MMGCTTFNGLRNNWQQNVPKLKADVYMFSKLATRLSLDEADMQYKDVELVKEYLVALQNLLVVPGQPNFAGARSLVNLKLPSKYQVYGLTIIDVLERYLKSMNLNVTEDQELILAIISSCLDGAIAGVEEFSG